MLYSDICILCMNAFNFSSFYIVFPSHERACAFSSESRVRSLTPYQLIIVLVKTTQIMWINEPLQIFLYRQLSDGHIFLCQKKNCSVCEPVKQGHAAHRSCHFQKPWHTCHNINLALRNACPLIFKLQQQTGRHHRRERVAHGIIFMVQKHFVFFPSYHELRQYRVVTLQLSCWEIARRGMWVVNSFFMAVYWDSTPTHARTLPG